ncbi:MAG: secretin N-terminal domain-containing protein [Alphaproteobacteria bacterium]|nr:MAG: secretin N-terminal domain-containing protein [Alphaproteobacteria bacterium]
MIKCVLKKLPLVLLFLTLSFSGCAHTDYHDPSLRSSQDSYESSLTDPLFDDAPSFVPPKIPKNTIGDAFKKPLDMTISGEIGVKELVHKIATVGKINLISNTPLVGDIFINSHRETAEVLLAKIAQVTNLAYQIEGDCLHILPNIPYTKTYSVQFLNIRRHKDSSLVIGTDIFNGGSEVTTGSQPSRGLSGSSTKIAAETTLDFWKELDANLQSLLQTSALGKAHEGSHVGDVRYSVHKQAGILTLTASHQQHHLVSSYLTLLRQQTNAQVLIEAKIIEVNLNDKFQGGIDWHSVKKQVAMGAPLGNLAQPGGYRPPGPLGARNVFSLGGFGRNISGFVRLLNVFGTVRTLSNPRLTVLNNNVAVLKAATNHVFFRVNYQREIRSLSRPDIERASSEVHTIPVGLIMTVQPSVDISTGRITMSLRPTITRITNEVEDPAVGILTSGQRSSTVPEVQVREMDSIIQIRTGEVVVLGGLMEERSDNIDARTPIPGLSHVLRGKDDQRTVTELVILMRAYILPEDQSLYNSADARIYNKFTKDPRRLRLQ